MAAAIMVQRTFRHASGVLARNLSIDITEHDSDTVVATATTNSLGQLTVYLQPGQYDFLVYDARIPFGVLSTGGDDGAAAAALQAHIVSLTPHPVYDDPEGPTLLQVFEEALA